MSKESIKMNNKQQSQFWDLVGNIHIGDQRQKMLFRPSSSVVLQTFILDQYNQMQKKWFSDVLKINPYLGWKLVLNFYIIKTVSTILIKFVSGIGFGVLYQLCIFQLMFILWKTYWIMVLRQFSVSSSFSYHFISASRQVAYLKIFMFRFGLLASNFYDLRRLVVVISKSVKCRKPGSRPHGYT